MKKSIKTSLFGRIITLLTAAALLSAPVISAGAAEQIEPEIYIPTSESELPGVVAGWESTDSVKSDMNAGVKDKFNNADWFAITTVCGNSWKAGWGTTANHRYNTENGTVTVQYPKNNEEVWNTLTINKEIAGKDVTAVVIGVTASANSGRIRMYARDNGWADENGGRSAGLNIKKGYNELVCYVSSEAQAWKLDNVIYQWDADEKINRLSFKSDNNVGEDLELTFDYVRFVNDDYFIKDGIVGGWDSTETLKDGTTAPNSFADCYTNKIEMANGNWWGFTRASSTQQSYNAGNGTVTLRYPVEKDTANANACLHLGTEVAASSVTQVVIGISSNADAEVQIYPSKDGLDDTWGKVCRLQVKQGFHEYTCGVTNESGGRMTNTFGNWNVHKNLNRFRFILPNGKNETSAPLDLEFSYVRLVNDDYFYKDGVFGGWDSIETLKDGTTAPNSFADCYTNKIEMANGNWWGFTRASSTQQSYNADNGTVTLRYPVEKDTANANACLHLGTEVAASSVTQVVMGISSNADAEVQIYPSKDGLDDAWGKVCRLQVKQGFHEYTCGVTNESGGRMTNTFGNWNVHKNLNQFRFTLPNGKNSTSEPLDLEFSYMYFMNKIDLQGEKIENGAKEYNIKNHVADFVFPVMMNTDTVNAAAVTINDEPVKSVTARTKDTFRVDMGDLVNDRTYTIRFNGIKTAAGADVTSEFTFTTPCTISSDKFTTESHATPLLADNSRTLRVMTAIDTADTAVGDYGFFFINLEDKDRINTHSTTCGNGYKNAYTYWCDFTFGEDAKDTTGVDFFAIPWVQSPDGSVTWTGEVHTVPDWNEIEVQ